METSPVYLLFFVTLLGMIKTQEAQQTSSKPLKKNCGIPVDAPGVTLNTQKLFGTWHEYMYFSGQNSSKHPTNVYASLTKASLSEADNFILNISFISVSDNRCVTLVRHSNLTLDGQKLRIAAPENAENTDEADPQHLKSYTVLYTGFNTVGIIFRCASQDSHTEICEDPLFWVVTRIKPEQLSPSTKSFIARKVDMLLSQYCMGAHDFSFTEWSNSMPRCSPESPEKSTKLNSLGDRRRDEKRKFVKQNRLPLPFIVGYLNIQTTQL